MLISLSMQYAIGGACSHAELTHRLKSAGLLRSDSVTAAFSSVDRAAFVPEDVTDPAVIYDNRFIRCGSFGSLCAPSMQVTVLELFQHLLGPGRRALDIGTGTGAMAVLFAEIGADVDAIDLDANAISSASLRHPHRSIRWKQEDAYQLDAADADSYDCIHVGACIEFVPETWLDLLRVGGMMVVPIGRADSEQTLMKLCKTADLLDGRHIIQRKAVQACKYEAMRSGSEDEGGISDRQLLKADVQQELRGWYEAFESRHGRKPNLADIKSDALMAKLLSRYRQQSRL